MVGKGPMPSAATADRGPRRGAARRLPGAGGGRRGGRPSPSTWSAARCATCCSAAAAPTSTSSSRATPPRWPPRSARRALVEHERFAHRQGRARTATRSTSPPPARETYPQPGRAAGGRARRSDHRDRPRPPRLHDQRDGDPAARRAAADRPPRRPGRPRGGPAAGPPPAAPSSTTRPGRSAPPATPPASASSWSRRPRRCCGRPTSAPSPADRRGAELLRLAAEATAPAGFELLAELGPDRAARGWGRAGRPRSSDAARGAPWRGEVDRAARRSSPRALGPAGGEVELAAARPRQPSRAVELAARPRPGRAGPGPRARAPSGSTTTSRDWRCGRGSRSTAPT